MIVRSKCGYVCMWKRPGPSAIGRNSYNFCSYTIFIVQERRHSRQLHYLALQTPNDHFCSPKTNTRLTIIDRCHEFHFSSPLYQLSIHTNNRAVLCQILGKKRELELLLTLTVFLSTY